MAVSEEALSSVHAQNIYTNGYQVSDVEDLEFHGEDLDLNLDAFSFF